MTKKEQAALLKSLEREHERIAKGYQKAQALMNPRTHKSAGYALGRLGGMLVGIHKAIAVVKRRGSK